MYEKILDRYRKGYVTDVQLEQYAQLGAITEEQRQTILNDGVALTLEEVKAQRIQQSKDDLDTYLEGHPITWTDGNQYSITREKQQQLTSKILSATLAAQTSMPYTLTWNATGEECTTWTLENLAALAFAIDARVTALVSYQQAQEALHPTAPISGTINEVFVHDGDSVSAGTALARIMGSTDLTIDFLFPYAEPSAFYVGQAATVYIGEFEAPVQGTVVSVSDSTTITSNGKSSSSVRVKLDNPGVVSDSYTASAVIGTYTSYGNSHITMGSSATVYASGSGTVTGFDKLAGSSVTKGEVLCTVESEAIRSQIENARLSLESARLSASTASGNLEDYNITSPISGTVIEKNFKAGDKVDGVSSGTLAVIYDLSCLKMEMDVSELDIGKVQVGQRVEITANALPGEVFTGTVEKVSINGTTTNGFTNYPVTISVTDYGELKPGMNVSATILCDSAENALCVPVDAVARGNTVLVPAAGALSEDGTSVADPSKLEERQVVLGRSNAEYIEITSGLEEGETVAYMEQSAEVGG